MKKFFIEVRYQFIRKVQQTKLALESNGGEDFADTAILPTLVQRIKEMFNYAG